ncbi:DNA mismatch repair protein MutS [Winogradskyella undariae]|uniref:Smr/MutS family protein n=1 Tax=Winogradskyella TaxID=286104 RepID=UPI00156AC965|nr:MULTISPECIES: Smr/MutS family protein [Winogradskyella]NRR92524.1 DNA mismatch repair protein MutS [Winogradskyella undariae]QXP78557.1 DNA mismatch repair protein MutS [Winogradskyella sp. HaHa_3_26]
MKFKISDKVETIDDDISGIITKISGDIITVEDIDGFDLQFEARELMLMSSGNSLESAVYNTDFEAVKKEKESLKRKSAPTIKPKERNAPKFEVDLHIHHLTKSSKRMSNYEMLNLQLDTARGQLEFAMRKRIPKVVFIHGVGEGVLRQELETLFSRYNNVRFYDADYKTYGLGATEVSILQNVAP